MLEREAIDKITSTLPTEWHREADRSVDLAVSISGKLYGFEFKSMGAHAKLFTKEINGSLMVTNIVPLNKSELSPSEYNTILAKFVREGVEGKFNYTLSSEDVHLSDIITSDSALKFRQFSENANKSTGRAHPLDEIRWLDFLFSVVSRTEYISSEELQQFLIEDGWDEQISYELALDFEYGIKIMQYIRAQRSNA